MILLQAKKFMRVSKRKTLKVDDLNHSISLYNFPALYGYDSYATSEYEQNETINSLWRPKQNIIDLEEYLSKPISTCPMNPFPHFHWFTIDGKKPNISENFIREEYIQNQQKSNNHNNANTNNTLITQGNSILNNSMINTNNSNSNNDNLKDNQNKGLFKVIPPVIHNISKELQIFFENFKQRFRKEIKISKLSPDPYLAMTKELEVSINVIKTEPGVVELLPYIIEFLMSNLTLSTDSKVQMAILYHIEAILVNQFFFIEPYLHQIITLLLSIILLETEGIHVGSIVKNKLFAINCLTVLTQRFQIKYPNFLFQLLSIFQSNLVSKTKPLYMTIFGAIESIIALGPVYSKKIILPLYDTILSSLNLSEEIIERINQSFDFIGNIDNYSNDIKEIKSSCVYYSLKNAKRLIDNLA